MAVDSGQRCPISLLNKYEIPVGHLTYEYIKTCMNVKELERIVKILRSGEEGFFPDLQKTAEDRLRIFSPTNKHLVKEKPVLTKHSMNKQEWENYLENFSKWKDKITERDFKLANESVGSHDNCLAPIRRVNRVVETKASDNSSTDRKIISDYATWDKYDVDCELLKMDLEEDKKASRQKEKNEIKEDVVAFIDKVLDNFSDTERRILAEQQNNRGNEYYTAKDFGEAVKCYTTSISMYSTAKAYNNRAACFLKLCKYSEALEDADTALILHPGNIKALYRRGIARQQKGLFKEALEDLEIVLKEQSTNVVAKNIVSQLRNKVQNKKISLLKNASSYCCEVNQRNTLRTRSPKFPQFSHFPNNSSANAVNIVELSDDVQPAKSYCCEVNQRNTLRPRSPKFPQFSHFPNNSSANAVNIVELSDDVQPAKSKLQIVEIN